MHDVAVLTFGILCIATIAQEAAGCHYGWKRYGRKCYFNSLSLHLNWFDAQSYCVLLGGYLAVPENRGEDQCLDKMLKASGRGCTLIGISDAVSEGRFVGLPNQRLIHYSNWNPGEPNNFAGSEDCTAIIKDWHSRWNDISCKHEGCNFICEKFQ